MNAHVGVTGASGATAEDSLLQTEVAEHRAVLEATLPAFEALSMGMLAQWETCISSGGKLLLFGNGGSASDAQHIAAELVVRYKTDRPAFAALALTTDTSTLTACGNDFGFDEIFARQVEALGRTGDVVVGISTSGRSLNVLRGLRQAKAMGLATSGFAGNDGGLMRELCDELFVVPSSVTARIQEMHIFAGHMLCKALEKRLGYG